MFYILQNNQTLITDYQQPMRVKEFRSSYFNKNILKQVQFQANSKQRTKNSDLLLLIRYIFSCDSNSPSELENLISDLLNQ